MAKGKASKNNGGHAHTTHDTPATQWIGGRLQTSIGVEAGGNRFYAELVLWAEVESGIILGSSMAEPGKDPDMLLRLFESVLEKPAKGPSRLPATIRVRTREDASLIATALPEGASLRVDPVPELDEILADFERVVGSKGHEASYFDDNVTPPALATLFAAAERLYRCAPWKSAHDSDLMRIDIPSLAIEGLCLSVLGNDDIVYGFSLFESLEDYDEFIERQCEEHEEGPDPSRPVIAMPWRLLSFDRGADLSKKMRAEVREHGWPVAAAKAYPTFVCNAGDGSPRPTSDDDLAILACCADALAAFARRHPRSFQDLHEDRLDDAGIVMEHHGEGLPPCRVTFPYDPEEWAEGPDAMMAVTEEELREQAPAIVRAWKVRHYETWPDHPLPALAGRTPRAACRSKKGRAEVDALLRDMESDEARFPEAERYDFSDLRAKLGL